MRSLCGSLRFRIWLGIALCSMSLSHAADLIWMPGKWVVMQNHLTHKDRYDSSITPQYACTTFFAGDPAFCDAYVALRNKGVPSDWESSNRMLDSGARIVIRQALTSAYQRGFRIIDINPNSGPADWWRRSWSLWLEQMQAINDSLYTKNSVDPLKLRLSVMLVPSIFLKSKNSFEGSIAALSRSWMNFNLMKNSMRLALRYADSLRAISPNKYMNIGGLTDTSLLRKFSTPLVNDPANDVCVESALNPCSDSRIRKYFASLNDRSGAHLYSPSSNMNLSVDDLHLWTAGYTGWIIDGTVRYLLDSLVRGRSTLVTPIHSVIFRSSREAETSLFPDDLDKADLGLKSPSSWVLSFPNADPLKNLEYDQDNVRGNFFKERDFFWRREELFNKMLAWFNASAMSHLKKYKSIAPIPQTGFYYQASTNASHCGTFDLYRTLAITKIGIVINSAHALKMGDSLEHQLGIYASTASVLDSIKKYENPNASWESEYSSPLIVVQADKFVVKNWDLNFLTSSAPGQGEATASAYYHQARATIQLGGLGVSYANWGPSMMISPPVNPVWEKVIGPSQAANSRIRLSLNAITKLPRSNIALLLPRDGRIDAERDVMHKENFNQKDFNRFMSKRIGNKKITYLTDSMVQASATPFAGIDTIYVFRRMAKSPAALPGFIQSAINKCPKRPKIKILDFSYPSDFGVDMQYLPKFVPVSFSPQY